MSGVHSLARRIVRPAVRREIPAIESVTVTAFAEFQDRVPAMLFDPYIEELRKVAERWDEAEVLVAEVAGRIVGTVSFYADASCEGLGLPAGWAGFRCLAVDPAMRGRGIGRGLVETCIDKARTLGAPAVGIHTASLLNAACNLYERLGFRRCPDYDMHASAFLDLPDSRGDVLVIAYRLDLAPN